MSKKLETFNTFNDLIRSISLGRISIDILKDTINKLDTIIKNTSYGISEIKFEVNKYMYNSYNVRIKGTDDLLNLIKWRIMKLMPNRKIYNLYGNIFDIKTMGKSLDLITDYNIDSNLPENDEKLFTFISEYVDSNKKINGYTSIRQLSSIAEFYHNQNEREHICFYCGNRREEFGKLHNNESDDIGLVTDYIPLCNDHIIPDTYMNITKIFRFCSSHNLYGYNGKCMYVHGHDYKLEVTLRLPKDYYGFTIDFGKLKDKVNKYIVDRFDHSYVNQILKDVNPTAENIILYIWLVLEKEALLKGLYKLRLWETTESYVDLEYNDILMSDYRNSYISDRYIYVPEMDDDS